MPVANHWWNLPDGKGGQVPHQWALSTEGPAFNVSISIPEPLAKLYADTGVPLPPPVAGMALIDTGATLTCVDESVPARLALAPIDRRPVLTPSGLTEQFRYAVRLDFPGSGVTTLPYWNVFGSKLSSSGQLIGGHPLIVLLGRDFLLNKILFYNGPLGYWTIGE